MFTVPYESYRWKQQIRTAEQQSKVCHIPEHCYCYRCHGNHDICACCHINSFGNNNVQKEEKDTDIKE